MRATSFQPNMDLFLKFCYYKTRFCPLPNFSKMHPEIEPTKKPLPPEATTFPPKENLASQFARVLEKVPESRKTYNFGEAAEFLNQRARDLGMETRVSKETVRRWAAITMAKIIEPVAFLPQEEPNSELFEELFPDEKAFPLSPTALASFKGSRWYRNTLSIDDLRGIVSYAQQAYEKGLMPEFRSARKIIEKFRDSCYNLQEIAKILRYRFPDYRFLRELDQLILNGALSLRGYPALLARTVGIPKDFFEREVKEEWLRILEPKKRETYRPRTLTVNFPKEFSSFSRFLNTILEPHGVTFKNKYLPLLTIYFQEKGVEIMTDTYEPTGRTYHILPLKAQEAIKQSIEDDQKLKEIIRIANEGFTLEEYTQTYRHRFPDGTPIALTEAIRLAGGPVILAIKSRLEIIKEILRKKNISLEEKLLAWGRKKTVLTYLPIEHLTEAVEVIKEAKIFRA